MSRKPPRSVLSLARATAPSSPSQSRLARMRTSPSAVELRGDRARRQEPEREAGPGDVVGLDAARRRAPARAGRAAGRSAAGDAVEHAFSFSLPPFPFRGERATMRRFAIHRNRTLRLPLVLAIAARASPAAAACRSRRTPGPAPAAPPSAGRRSSSEFLGPARPHRAAVGGRNRRDPLPHHRRFPALRLPRPARHPDRLRRRSRARRSATS